MKAAVFEDASLIAGIQDICKVFFSYGSSGFVVSNSTEHNLLNEFILHKYYTRYSTEMRVLQQKSTLMLKLFCITNLFYIFCTLALPHGWQAAHVCHQDTQSLTPTACHQPILV